MACSKEFLNPYRAKCMSDGAGRRSGAADETGTLFASEFDESGNVIRARAATGEETCLSYDPEGRLIDVSRNGNLTARYSYGNDGLLVSVENASGYKFKYARDAFGRPLCLYDEKGALLEAIYDKAGRLVSLCDSTGAKRRYGWDADGFLSRVQDERGLEVSLLRNPARLVSEVARSAGDNRRVERIDYDERDRAISVVDAAGRKTSYDYDGAGRPCRMVDRGGSVYERSYDGAGRLSEVSLPDGSKIGYSYDVAGALIGVETSKATAYIERGLDGRVLAVERSNQPAFGYKRDGTGRMIARTYADAPAEKFSFDERGQLSSMARDKAKVSYGYDELGRLVERRLGSSVVERYAYDMRNLLVNYTLEATGKVVRACRYERDRAGRKIAEEVVEGGSTTNRRFAYDSCGRLSEVEEDGVLKARYSYDAFGNRSTMDSDAGHIEYTYDECDRLLSERTEGGETHYSYDPCGRLVSIDGERGSHSYSYDDAGRLMDAETPKGAVSFKHDALGKRRKSKRAGRTERRACDPLRPYNDTAWIEGRAYLFDVSLSAAVEEDGSVLYVACDELGSPTHVFDENGTLLQAYSYDEFGVEKETHTERLIPFGFTGYEMDGTGMLFAQARQYDPRTGRFCSEDVVRGTVARPQTLNRYSYCQGNPVGLVDRDGREASSGNLLDQFDEFWRSTIVGTDTVTARQDGPNGTYVESYDHGGGGTFVWSAKGEGEDQKTTGFSIDMPSIETPWGWAFGTSFNVSYPTNGNWVPEITSSVNIEQDNTVASGSFGFNQKGLITDFNTSANMPNVIGTYSGIRTGTKTDIADWGEVALAVSTVVAVVAIAAIIIDDVTLVGVLDDPLVAPLLAWLASGGAAASAIGTRLVGVLSTPAMSTGASAACAALR